MGLLSVYDRIKKILKKNRKKNWGSLGSVEQILGSLDFLLLGSTSFTSFLEE